MIRKLGGPWSSVEGQGFEEGILPLVFFLGGSECGAEGLEIQLWEALKGRPGEARARSGMGEVGLGLEATAGSPSWCL